MLINHTPFKQIVAPVRFVIRIAGRALLRSFLVGRHYLNSTAKQAYQAVNASAVPTTAPFTSTLDPRFVLHPIQRFTTGKAKVLAVVPMDGITDVVLAFGFYRFVPALLMRLLFKRKVRVDKNGIKTTGIDTAFDLQHVHLVGSQMVRVGQTISLEGATLLHSGVNQESSTKLFFGWEKEERVSFNSRGACPFICI